MRTPISKKEFAHAGCHVTVANSELAPKCWVIGDGFVKFGDSQLDFAHEIGQKAAATSEPFSPSRPEPRLQIHKCKPSP